MIVSVSSFNGKRFNQGIYNFFTMDNRHFRQLMSTMRDGEVHVMSRDIILSFFKAANISVYTMNQMKKDTPISISCNGYFSIDSYETPQNKYSVKLNPILAPK